MVAIVMASDSARDGRALAAFTLVCSVDDSTGADGAMLAMVTSDSVSVGRCLCVADGGGDDGMIERTVNASDKASCGRRLVSSSYCCCSGTVPSICTS